VKSTNRKRSLVTDITNEQYGATVGTVEWRKSPLVTLVGNGCGNVSIRDQQDVIVAIPSERVQDETGGIFLGLIQKDDYRPTVMEQFGYTCIAMNFQTCQLVLSRNSLEHRHDDSMELFDFTGYGPDIHHYGVLCEQLQCHFASNKDNHKATVSLVTFHAQQLSRPIVAVFDTGLSGCIFSDTLWQDIQQQMRVADKDKEPIGCTILLSAQDGNHEVGGGGKHNKTTVKVSSYQKHWRFQSFRLPWWYESNDSKDSFPHVVVLGSAFWRHPTMESLTLDTNCGIATIQTTNAASI
jgi:hypothetical protein